MSRRVNKTKDKRPGAQRDLTSLLEDMQIETPELQPQTQLTTADLFGAESTFQSSQTSANFLTERKEFVSKNLLFVLS